MNIGKANPAHLFQKVLKEQEHEMSILNFININFGMIFYFDHGIFLLFCVCVCVCVRARVNAIFLDIIDFITSN